MQVRLRVMGSDARPQIIDMEVASPGEAVRQAVARGVRVLGIESNSSAESTHSRRGVFPLLLFSQELLALLDAGLNLTQALDTLHAKENRGWVKELFAVLLQSLREGRAFSDALARHPQHFPDVYVATVRAAERTGDLPQALGRHIAYQLQLDGLRKKLMSAGIYPAMLLIVGGCVLLFLLGYVVPKFSVVYESANRELPWLSAALLGFGKTIHEHWVGFATGLALVVAALALLLSRKEVRRKLADVSLRIPVLAKRAADFRLTRFYRAVALLLASGIPLTRALAMVSGLLSDSQQQALLAARRQVESGQALSDALIAHGLAGPVAESLVRIGESTGRLGDMLERTAAFHDEEFARWIDWTSRLLEPLLMTFIGLVIGTVVVLMYIPIFELAGGLQ